MDTEIIHVAVGVILDEIGRVLISRRPQDAHQGGLWEFPGGKLETGESVDQALKRELSEELGIDVICSRPLIKLVHHYEDVSVCLDVHTITGYAGTPEGLEGQPLRWCDAAKLNPDELPAADIPVINALSLPSRYLITGRFESVDDFRTRLTGALSNQIRLVQLRIKPDWYQDNRQYFDDILAFSRQACDDSGATLMLNIPDQVDAGDGVNVHADSRRLQLLQSRPDCEWFSASCHTQQDLHKAESLGADFAVLSPVRYTTSHPDTMPIGWQQFADMVSQVNIPVYALGGVDGSHIDTAIEAGGQGVAAISAFWQ